MSSSVYLRYENAIPFDNYTSILDLRWNADMPCGIYYYKGEVQVEYKGEQIVVSSYHMNNLVTIADMANEIIRLTQPIRVSCDEELRSLVEITLPEVDDDENL